MPKRKSYAQGPSTRRGRGSKPGSSNKRVKRSGPGYTRTGGFYGRFAGANAEKKFFDTSHSYLLDTTAEVPTSGQLCLIPQGVTESTRVGRKCTITSIQGKWVLRLVPAASATAGGVYAIYLVQDMQCNGAAAAASDVFDGADPILQHRFLANSSRFKVLKKFTGVLSPKAGVSTAYNHDFKYINFYKKCNIPLEFSNTTGAITELRSNNIFLVAAAGGGGTIDDLITVIGYTRLRFSDGS